MATNRFQALLSASNKASVVPRLKPATGKAPRNERNAAVLVPLHLYRGKPSILFTVRSGQLSKHRNQVSFPGGMVDEDDKNMAATALRETEEELGIPASQVDVWGALPSIPDRVYSGHPYIGFQLMKLALRWQFGTLKITPVIGNVGEIDPEQLKINPAEVVAVFSLSVEHLANPDNHRHTKFRKPLKFYFPVFLGGSRRVWGITGFILDAALTQIVPPELNYTPLSSFGAAYAAKT